MKNMLVLATLFLIGSSVAATEVQKDTVVTHINSRNVFCLMAGLAKIELGNGNQSVTITRIATNGAIKYEFSTLNGTIAACDGFVIE